MIRQRFKSPKVVYEPEVDINLAFDIHEPRLPDGKWTKLVTRGWLKDHPVDSKNVVDMWDKATPGEKQAGEVWYPHAHKVALALGKRYGISTREAAGLLATYSPQTAWGKNLRTAAEVLREHHAIGGPGAHEWWHRDPDTPNTVEWREGVMAPGVSKKRAARIMAGEDFEDVFAGGRIKSGALKPNSLKIRAFAELIANGVNDPDDPKVVIDRHAAGVARGVRMTNDDYDIAGPSSSRKKFTEYSKAFRDAAKQISAKEGRTIPPEAVQAATWLVRQRLNGDMENRVGRTRQTLGEQDTANLKDYVEQYLPEAFDYLPQVGTADLANPAIQRQPRPTETHTVPQPVNNDETIQHIAEVLLAGATLAVTIESLSHVLEPFGIGVDAIRMALGLARNGTSAAPHARLADHRARLDGQVRKVRDREVFYRAAYIANASKRIGKSLLADDSPRVALRREVPYYRAHEEARKGRLDAVAQVQRTADIYGWKDDRGTLVGWYLNPLLKNEVECITANGHNFYVEEGTVIGLPGSVHNRCGCYAGPPIEGATLVNDAMHNVVKFQKSRPKFKLREKRTA